ncbi:hypothetical protein VNO78_32246 [Psophocarpus tetragonolobus]|uniref:Uncharacterized protein n=1 Tax=Psophocarpus tetragonolobus TaxID=3891 RepID=A0AAN9NW65_PSOTE
MMEWKPMKPIIQLPETFLRGPPKPHNPGLPYELSSLTIHFSLNSHSIHWILAYQNSVHYLKPPVDTTDDLVHGVEQSTEVLQSGGSNDGGLVKGRDQALVKYTY